MKRQTILITQIILVIVLVWWNHISPLFSVMCLYSFKNILIAFLLISMALVLGIYPKATNKYMYKKYYNAVLHRIFIIPDIGNT